MSTGWQIAFAVQSLAIVVLGVLLLGLLRRLTPTLEAAVAGGRHDSDSNITTPHGLQPGAVPEPFTLTDAAGTAFTLPDVLAASGTLVLFLSAHCAPCVTLAAELMTVGRPPRDTALVVIEQQGEPPASLAGISWLRTYRDDGRYSVATAFQTNATPHAFLLDAAGAVRRNFIPTSAEQLVDVLRSASLATPTDSHDHHHQPTPAGLARLQEVNP